MQDATARRLSRLHALLYRLRIGWRLVDNDMLLLTTRGRRTGRPHTVPLLYLRDGETLVVVASWGGRPRHPEWYLNLVEAPDARVRVGRAAWPVTARTAQPSERARWWPRLEAAYRGYASYQSRTARQIPVVMLERSG